MLSCSSVNKMRQAVLGALIVVVATAATCGVAVASASDWGPTMASCGGAHPIPPLDAASAAQKPVLKQVQVFIRHGDRLPTTADKCWNDDDTVWECTLSQLQKSTITRNKELNIDRMYNLAFIPDREALPGNCGLGMLTDIGRTQEHQNGQYLADAYVKSGLLPPSYFSDPSTFWMRSDGDQRTIESGQSLFTGMYPPSSSSTEEVPWLTMDKQYDNLGFNPVLCPAVTAELASATKSAAFTTFVDSIEARMTNITNAIGLDSSSGAFSNSHWLRSCANTHACHNYAVPSVVQDNFQFIQDVAYQGYKIIHTYGNVTRFGIGPLVNNTWENMKKMMDGTDGAQAFRLISGHDTAPIMPLVAAFGLWDGEWSWYASLIAMELYSVNGSWAVRVVYNGKAVTVPGCSDVLCDIDEFEAIVNGIIPSIAECHRTQFPSNIDGPSDTLRHLPGIQRFMKLKKHRIPTHFGTSADKFLHALLSRKL